MIYCTHPVYNLSFITVPRENIEGQKSLSREVYTGQGEFGHFWTKRTNSSRLTWKEGFNSIIHYNKKKKKKKKIKAGRLITSTYLSTSIATSKIVSIHKWIFLHNAPLMQGSPIILILLMKNSSMKRLSHLSKVTQDAYGTDCVSWISRAPVQCFNQ